MKRAEVMGCKIFRGILAGLALLAQLMVPAAASRINAQAFDPFGHIVICVSDAAPSADNSAQGNLPAHHAHCPLCQIAVAGSPLLDTRSVSIAALYSDARPVSWAIPPAGRQSSASTGANRHADRLFSSDELS